MPIYEYIAVAESCSHCCDGFDQLQKLSDPQLSQCPRCGKAVQRKISAPSVAIGGTHLTRESHIEKHGFTQYRKAGGGVYEKTAGKGPDYISGD
ncbi:FmdB family zinc ribbon protein [Tahibacter amnicola]|uniref:Zinc ribbon domain-containing protein n=1 Tax=Tahibacter amnicola TaxID=2976241 RepID=A0ABY6BCH6_9GAMM|nr:zinc ribbon domain-containing protein [Tahibacter amnicola]UXI67276.1 zinc ribbon domain-containing protein [Tahibacter amnicola]